jgi:hypothetical protein
MRMSHAVINTSRHEKKKLLSGNSIALWEGFQADHSSIKITAAVRSQASSCQICRGGCGIRKRLSPSTPAFLVSTIPPNALSLSSLSCYSLSEGKAGEACQYPNTGLFFAGTKELKYTFSILMIFETVFFLFKGFNASPTCPSEKNGTKTKISRKRCQNVTRNTNAFCEQNAVLFNVKAVEKLPFCLKVFSGFWLLRLQRKVLPRVEDV